MEETVTDCETTTTPWSGIGDRFLSEGEWAIGQGVDAPDRKLLRHLVVRLLEDHEFQGRPTSLLEVGSGPGIEVEGLGQAGLLDRVDYTGYDFTPELVAACRNAHRSCRFEQVDAQEMTDDAAYDIVWCRHVLEHVPDWERALRNVIRASREAALVSWFIRPAWRESDVGSGVSEGFLHHTVSARRALAVASESGRTVARLDFDHYAIRGSVWLIAAPHAAGDLIEAALRFAASPDFLDSLLPVPDDARELERDLLGVVEDAHRALALAEPTIERVYPWYATLAQVREARNRCHGALERGLG